MTGVFAALAIAAGCLVALYALLRPLLDRLPR